MSEEKVFKDKNIRGQIIQMTKRPEDKVFKYQIVRTNIPKDTMSKDKVFKDKNV